MIEKETFIYDEYLDRLAIFNTLKDNEKIEGSVNILNLIIDITSNNRIANIEIIDVSEFFQSLEIDPIILQQLEEARIVVNQIRGGFLLKILLRYGDKTLSVPISLPTENQMAITA
jgi:hypothetical protein